MEQCLNNSVDTNEVAILKSDESIKNSWKPFLRQIIICSGVLNAYFNIGLCFGVPTVVIPQLRREANSTEAVSQDMASWISSIFGYAAIPWLIIPIISARIGRKYPFFVVTIITLTSYIMFYCSSTPKHILIAEILQGAQVACTATISVVIITEYTSPKYRGLFLTLKSASFNWGIWVSNTLGTFFHWKTIAILGIICTIYNLLTTLFWCESPSWLASKHRYKECAKVHRWVKGEDAESEKELAALIRSCKQYQEDNNRKNIKRMNLFTRSYKTLLDKLFYMPILLCISILILYSTSGKLVCTIYAIDILKKITTTETAAYMSMLLLDGVTIIGMYIGCGVAKYVKRRTLLLTGSSGGIFFLFLLALYLFLCKSKDLDENMYVTLALLTLFFLFISFGPMIMSTSIYGELMPLQYKTAAMFITAISSFIFSSTTLKTAPQLIKMFDLHGAFLLYGILSTFIILFLFKFLPETKDKTLQEIEDYFVDNQRKEKSIEALPMYKN